MAPSRAVSQSVWLKVDPKNDDFAVGRTEICFDVRSNAIEDIDLHCHGIHVDSVAVEGEETTCSWSSPAGGTTEGDLEAAYKSVCESWLEPNMRIAVPPRVRDKFTLAADGTGDKAGTLTLTVAYRVALGESVGLLRHKGYITTNDSVGSTSAWVPCVDSPGHLLQQVDLHFVVPSDHIPVSSGELKTVHKSERRKFWKMYHYVMPYECSLCDVGFVVGPFRVEATAQVASSETNQELTLNQFVPQDEEADVMNMSSFMRIPLELYGDVTGGVLPTPMLNVAFVPHGVLPAEMVSGIGFLAISIDCIVDKSYIEGSQRVRCDVSLALAKQWFGYLVRPLTFNDLWLVCGLQHWLADQFIRSYIGKTDWFYKRWQRHVAVAEMDNGEPPPLAFHGWRQDGCSWGVFYGTERSDPSLFFSMKSAAVLAMIENRSGEQLFKKQVENTVRCGTAAAPSSHDSVRHPSRTVDAKLFLTELSKAGDFRAEVLPFMERWVFGSGAPCISLGVQFHRRGCLLDVGLKQVGSEAAFRASMAAEMEAKKEKMGISGIIKVAVQEGSGVKVDHPLHLGAKGYLAQTVKVNPEVKKIAGKRGRKKKSEEALVAAKQAALQNAQHPVQYVRLDSTSEFLCLKIVHQPTRMMVNKLVNSRDVVAQAEAVRELAHTPVSTLDPKPLESLTNALEDDNMHWVIRCEAAIGLSQLVYEDGNPAGINSLIGFYKKRFWDDQENTPVRISFANIEEYLVTKAVIVALSQCTSSNGFTDFDAISFLLESIDGFWPQETDIDWRPLLATLLQALGDLRCDNNEAALVDLVTRRLFKTLSEYLKKHMVLDSTNYCVAEACLLGLVSLTCNDLCPREIVQGVFKILVEFCNRRDLPPKVSMASFRAAARFRATWQGYERAFFWCLALLDSQDRLGAECIRIAWKELAISLRPATVSLQLLNKVRDALVDTRFDAHIRHLIFVASCALTGSSIYVSETYADAKPSLIKLNAPIETQQKEDSLKNRDEVMIEAQDAQQQPSPPPSSLEVQAPPPPPSSMEAQAPAPAAEHPQKPKKLKLKLTKPV